MKMKLSRHCLDNSIEVTISDNNNLVENAPQSELVQNATVAKYATVQIDASLENNRTTEHYNL